MKYTAKNVHEYKTANSTFDKTVTMETEPRLINFFRQKCNLQ